MHYFDVFRISRDHIIISVNIHLVHKIKSDVAYLVPQD